MYYIIENDKLSKYQKLFVQAFNVITLEGNVIKVAPIPKLKIKEEDGRKLAKRKDIDRIKKRINNSVEKTAKLLSKTNSKKIVLSKNLKKYKEFKNYLYSRNLDIVSGNFLFSLLAPEVLEYLINKKELNRNDFKIAILANDLNEIVLGNIYKIIREYKNTTVVTRHVAKLKKVQSNLYEKEGIVLAVTNNKRKSLNKTSIILNFDFPEELLNKYSIYEKASIINFNNKVKINKKRFNGININDFEIECQKEKIEDMVEYNKELIDNIHIKDIYEAQLYKKQSYKLLREQIKNNQIKIKYLCGNKIKY